MSNRRSSYPAPAPFASALLNHTAASASASADTSRRNTLDLPLPPPPKSPLHHSATNGTTSHPPPAAVASAASELDVSSLVSAVDELLVRRLGELSGGVHEELVRLQVDLFRQFHAQSLETAELVAGLRQENREMREEMGRLREELTEYRAAGPTAAWP